MVGPSNAIAKQYVDVERERILASEQIEPNHVLVGCFGLEMRKANKTETFELGFICLCDWKVKIKTCFSEFYLPIPKFFGRFSNNGLTTFFGSTFLTANGAGATFLPEPAGFFFFKGCKNC